MLVGATLTASCTAGRAVALVAFGLLAWTLLEYISHRALFHLPREHVLARFGARMHLDHHDDPHRTPITKPLGLTAPMIAMATSAAAVLANWSLYIVAGTVLGYLVYELLHVAAHVLGDDVHPWPRLRRWHLGHHAEPTAQFGITTRIWDELLGTSRGRSIRD